MYYYLFIHSYVGGHQGCFRVLAIVNSASVNIGVHVLFQIIYGFLRVYALISHTGKVMLKILQARLQQYMNHELPDIQTGFAKGRGTRDQIANIRWIIKKAREFQKNVYFCFIDCAKAFDCVNYKKLWKILKDHLTCLLINLYAGQKSTVRTGHGTTGWSK